MADTAAAAADCDRRTPRVTVSTLLLAVFTFKQEARRGRKEKRKGGKKRDSGTEEWREKMEEAVNVAEYSVPGNSRRENTVLVSVGRP